MKDRKTYKILSATALLLPLPLNRMYLGEPFFGRLITLNYFYIGGIADLFYMDKRFDESMNKRGFTNTDIRNNQAR
jgi:TM2 domain-containing membrane protein YozV